MREVHAGVKSLGIWDRNWELRLKVERQVIEDILRMLEDMKVVVVILNLHRDSYGAKYMITVPFLVNQIAWLIANHVVKTGENGKRKASVR